MKKMCGIVIAVLLGCFCMNVNAQTSTAVNKYALGEFVRTAEALDRGLVAMKTDKGVYLSWRLLDSEDTFFGSAEENVGFVIYRDGDEIAREYDTTNYIDTNGTMKSQYSVATLKSDAVGEACDSVSVLESQENYFDIPLEVPAPASVNVWVENLNEENGGHYEITKMSYEVNDCSCGDLDGDGEYEIVIKWQAGSNSMVTGGFAGPALLEAYKLDGTRLWENPINLGANVFVGPQNIQFLVYDFDGDGSAEITCTTSAGSMDSKGEYVNLVSTDENVRNIDNSEIYVDKTGRVLTGVELFSIFSGRDGSVIDTIYNPIPRGDIKIFGDTSGQRATRYIADVSYLDGNKPYAVYWRGYYPGNDIGPGRTCIFGASFDGERLNPEYVFDTYDMENSEYAEGYTGIFAYTEGNEKFVGQGNHNITTADVDGDAKDEIISGALCLEVNDENKLMPKWCSGRGHGDALHIADYDPNHAGLEYFSVHESGNFVIENSTTASQGKIADYGMTLYDAATGEELFHMGNKDDTARGLMANIGAGGYFSMSGSANYSSGKDGIFETSAEVGDNFRIFWDGDLYDEILDSDSTNEAASPVYVKKWDGNGGKKLFNATGTKSINGTKANPSLQADILGDWREEIIVPTIEGDALRIYTTDIYTDYKIKTLMHDSVYRAGIAAQQSGYNQPPHIGFYLNEELFKTEETKFDPNAFYADDFSGYTTTGVGVQSSEVQTSSMGKLNITIGARSNGNVKLTLAMNALALVSGGYSTAQRGISLAFDEACGIPEYAEVAEGKVLSLQFDTMFTDANSTLQIFGLTSNEAVSSNVAVNDPYLSAANNADIPLNEWVHVQFLIHQDGKTIMNISQGEKVICVKTFQAVGKKIEKIASYGGATIVYLDNLEVSEKDDNSYVLTIKVKDENSLPLKGAEVIFGNKTQTTDAEGKAVFVVNGGVYSATLSKLGYEDAVYDNIEIISDCELEYVMKTSSEAPVLSEIKMTQGSQLICVPYARKNASSKPFKVECFDQYGYLVPNCDISWEISPQNEHISIKNGVVIVENGYKCTQGHEQEFLITVIAENGGISVSSEAKITVSDHIFYETSTGQYGGELNTLPTTGEEVITIPVSPKTEYMTLPENIAFEPKTSQKLEFMTRIETKDIYNFKRYIEILDKDGNSALGPICFANLQMGLDGTVEGDAGNKFWVWENEEDVFGDINLNTWVKITMLFETDENGNTAVTVKVNDANAKTKQITTSGIAKIAFTAEKANAERMIAFKNFIITDETENKVPPVFEEKDYYISPQIKLYNSSGAEITSLPKQTTTISTEVILSDDTLMMCGEYVDVYTAIYDSLGNMISLKKENVLMYSEAKSVQTFDIPVGAAFVQAFVWRNGEMIPVSEKARK